MTKFNYNEPEFKVVTMSSEDVLTASVELIDENFDSGKVDGGSVGFGTFSI